VSDEVAVLHKALDILESLAERPKSAAELSAEAAVSKPTVYRILHTLEGRAFVAKERESRRYTLGAACERLWTAGEGTADLVSVARPVMARLAQSFKETVNLAVRSNGEIVYVAVVEGEHRLQTRIPTGTRDHLHSTALGKAILAALPPPRSRQALEKISRVRLTPNTLVTVTEIRRELEATRQRGFAIDSEENELGSVCVACALRGADGLPVAAISISGPRARIDDDLVERIGAELVGECKALGDVLSSVRLVKDVAGA
jgi:IclR family acetate operon transcriptional repressor